MDYLRKSGVRVVNMSCGGTVHGYERALELCIVGKTTDQDRADIFKNLVAYTGTYRVEGDKWITKVDVAGNPALLVGGEHVGQHVGLDGNGELLAELLVERRLRHAPIPASVTR